MERDLASVRIKASWVVGTVPLMLKVLGDCRSKWFSVGAV